MLRCLVDTNVALDFLLAREGFAADAERIFQCADDGRIEVVFAATSLKDVYYVAAKYAGREKAELVVDYLSETCLLGGVDAGTCRLARRLDEPDFEDALVAAVALENDVDVILSRDAAAFEKCGVPKLTPRVFCGFFLSAKARELELDCVCLPSAPQRRRA